MVACHMCTKNIYSALHCTSLMFMTSMYTCLSMTNFSVYVQIHVYINFAYLLLYFYASDWGWVVSLSVRLSAPSHYLESPLVDFDHTWPRYTPWCRWKFWTRSSRVKGQWTLSWNYNLPVTSSKNVQLWCNLVEKSENCKIGDVKGQRSMTMI